MPSNLRPRIKDAGLRPRIKSFSRGLRPPRHDPEEDTLRELIPAYENAKDALREALTLDEVQSITSEFDQLRAAGRIDSDVDFELTLAELKLREFRRVGEISSGLEKSKGGRGKTVSDDGNSSANFKLARLQQAGISPSRAYRAERVAGISESEFEKILEACRNERKAVTVNDVLNRVEMQRRVADLDGVDLDEGSRHQRAESHARRREHEIHRDRKDVEHVLRRLDRQLSDKHWQRIEVALIAASGLPLTSDLETLLQLLRDEDVISTIRSKRGEARALFIHRLLEDMTHETQHEEYADEGFMPGVFESKVRQVAKAIRGTRAEAEAEKADTD